MTRSRCETGTHDDVESRAIVHLEHRIPGGASERDCFEVPGAFGDASLRIRLPRLMPRHVHRVLAAAQRAKAPPLRERRAFLLELARWWPGDAALEGAARITGMPVSWLAGRIQEGRGLAERFAYRQSADSVATVFAGLPPDDPGEIFHLISAALLAGAPLVLRASSGEPFLAADAVRWMHAMDVPPELLQLVYADETSPAESLLVRGLMDAVDFAVGGDDAGAASGHPAPAPSSSCAVVLDAPAAFAHLSRAAAAPRASRAERDFVCVGETNAVQVSDALVAAYASLRPGDLLDPETTLGRCDDTAVRDASAALRDAEAAGTMRPYARRGSAREVGTVDAMRTGLVVEMGDAHGEGDPPPLLAGSWPVYVSGVRQVDTVDEAVREVARASAWTAPRGHGPRFRAISVYAAGSERAAALPALLAGHAHEVHVDRSPLGMEGWLHEGDELCALLSAYASR